MKKHLLLIICSLFIISITNYPKGDKEGKDKLQKATDQKTYTFLDINNIATYFYNNGNSDITPNGNSGFEYPKGTRKTAVFASGLLWGAKVAGDPDPRVGGSAYRTGLQPGIIQNDGTAADPTSDRYRIYRVRKNVYPGGPTVDLSNEANREKLSISEIRADYEKDWAEWPADLGAPFTDNNNNGQYEPSVDVPGVPGADQTIWFVANDLDSTQSRYLFGANPLGIEIQATIWAYNRPGPVGNMLFRKYKLINKTGTGILPPVTFDSMYVSMWTDADLGGAGDDFVGTDSALSLIYTYNASETDATYNPLPPPAVGFSFLQGPLINGVAGEDRNNNGVDDAVDFGIYDGKKIGPGKINLPMTTGYAIIKGTVGFGDPPQGSIIGSREFYNFFQGFWNQTGAPFINPIDGSITKYIYNGDPQKGTGWLDGLTFPPGDRRNGSASGPFTMAPGDTQEVIIAEIIGGAQLGSDRLSAIGDLKAYAQTAKYLYDEFFEPLTPPKPPQVKAVELDKKIILDWGEDLSVVNETESFSKGGYTFQGYNVYQLPSLTSTLSEAKRIATFDKIDGVRIILETYYDPVANTFLKRVAQYGSDSGIKRSLSITIDYLHYDSDGKPLTLINGIKYYFAVTAYSYSPNLIDLSNNFENTISSTIFIVTPHSPDPGVTYSYSPGDTLAAIHSAGTSEGSSFALVIDPTKVTSHSYEVTFNNDGSWNLVDKTTGTTKLENQTNFSGDADYLFIDGLQVKVLGPKLVGKSWTYASADPLNVSPVMAAQNGYAGGSRWFTGGGHGGELLFGGVFMEPNFWGGTTVTPDKYNVVEIRWRPMASYTDLNGNGKFDIGEPYAVDDPSKTQKAFMYSAISGGSYLGFFTVPFTAWDVSTDPANPRQLNVCMRDSDKDHQWSLHHQADPKDPLLPNNGDQRFNYTWILTTDYDATGTMYGDGTGGTLDFWDGGFDQVLDGQWVLWLNEKGTSRGMLAEESILTLTPSFLNTAADVFSFSTKANSFSIDKAKIDVEKINVFPNPYYAQSTDDLTRFGRFVTFTHLPVKAKIRIFNLGGQLVRVIDKDDNSQFTKWDLLTTHGFLAGSGIYIAYIEMPDLGTTKILKIAIVQGVPINNFSK